MATTTAPTFKRFSLESIRAEGFGLPSKVIFYGVPGIGKSSWAGHAPSPIFVMSELEKGILGLKDANLVPKNCKVFPDQIKSWPDIFLAIDTLENTEHDYKTAVFDVVNGLERTCHEMVCVRDFKNNMAVFRAYEQGPRVAVNDFKQLLVALDRLQEKRHMMIILLAHCKVAGHKHPDGAYDRWVPNMYSETWSLVHGWADTVLFANHLTVVKDGKGYGGTDRLIYTQHAAAWDAKSKGLPPMIPMGTSAKTAWDNFASAMIAAKANNNGSAN